MTGLLDCEFASTLLFPVAVRQLAVQKSSHAVFVPFPQIRGLSPCVRSREGASWGRSCCQADGKFCESRPVMQSLFPFLKSEASPLVFGQEKEQAGVEAAAKLMGNFARVVQDIMNQGPKNIDGKKLTQEHLKRLDPTSTISSTIRTSSNTTVTTTTYHDNSKIVQKMLSAVCCRLLGKETAGPANPGEALVWMLAARFLSSRIQAPGECSGRKSDMGKAQAEAMRTVLAQIEAGSKLMANREMVVQDITNPGPRAVKGGKLTQAGLKRVDRKHQACVDAMVQELIGRLYGKSPSHPSSLEEVRVWIEAAAFFGGRVQGSQRECEGRTADMSLGAAQALRTMVGSMEAALKLMANREFVVMDLVNPGPKNIEGFALSQTDLKRVDMKHKASVDNMVTAVISRLGGQGVAGPLNPEEALVWLEAATYLSARVQIQQMTGRNPDMSGNAAAVFKQVLAEFEAASKLMSNFDTVLLDITNSTG